MSGRSLRRLPVVAHARYIGCRPAARMQMTTPMVISPHLSNGSIPHRGQRENDARPTFVNGGGARGMGTDVELWLMALERALDDHKGQKERFNLSKTEAE